MVRFEGGFGDVIKVTHGQGGCGFGARCVDCAVNGGRGLLDIGHLRGGQCRDNDARAEDRDVAFSVFAAVQIANVRPCRLPRLRTCSEHCFQDQEP